VLDKITPATHPILFNVINRKLEVGWTVNAELYHVHVWALKEKTEAFAEIWEQQNPEAKVTKLREAKAIGDIAKRFIDKTFFHLYYFDFRGRIYPATAYLHEQGSDLARGLLLRSDSKAIGREGFFWLCVSIASNWGGSCGRRDGAKTDKIPLKDRFQWVLDNEDIFLDYASNPKEYQNWMQADKPWQFLAACIELRKLREWQTNFTFDGSGPDYSNYNYESHLEVYIDGSNNGSQHLSALTRDEVTAPHVNLVPSDLPGDLYKYIADHVWARLEKAYNDMAPFERELCETFIDNIIDLKRQIYEAEPQSEERKCLIDKIQKEKNLNIFLQDKACVVYWLRVTDPKERRKICKRNVMTLPLTRRK
jgi:DNA-directed RNA polymerase